MPEHALFSVPTALATLCFLPLLAQGPPGTSQGGSEEAEILRDLLEVLNTPVVSASKSRESLRDAPATLIVITRADLQARGYTKFYEILDDLPGFDQMTLYGDTFVKPYARGFRNAIGDSILLMIDGQVFNHLWYNTIDEPLTTLPLTNIQQIEVVYGPASAVYGPNAFMGVINVITSRGGGKTQEASVDLIAGSLNQHGVDASFLQRLGDWRLSLGSRIYHGDMDGKAANRYVYTSGAVFLDPNGWGRTIFGKLLDRWRTEATSPYTSRAFDLRLAHGGFEFGIQHMAVRSGYGLFWSWDHYLPKSAVWEQPEWAFFTKYEHAFTPNLNTNAVVRYRRSNTSNESVDYEVDWLKSADAPGGVRGFWVRPENWSVANSSLSFTQDFNWKASPSLSLNFGFLLSEEILQRTYESNNKVGYLYLSSQADYSLDPPKPSQELANANHNGILRRGIYLQMRYRMGRHQSLLLGGRNDWHSAFRGASTLRAGYLGEWGGWAVKALYGQAYQEPNSRLLFGGWAGAGSSPTLEPERSNTSEVSVGYTQSRWSLLADLYQVRNANIILSIPGGARNVGLTKVTALDVHAQFLIPGARGKEQKIWAYATHHFKQTSGPYLENANVMNSDEVPDIAKDAFRVGWTASFPGDMTVTLRGRYFGPRKTVATNPVGRIPAYQVVDAYFEAGLRVKGLSMGLKITNLLGEKYEQPGLRNASAGVQPPGFNSDGDYEGSRGYNSSLLPQAGRAFEAMVRYRF